MTTFSLAEFRRKNAAQFARQKTWLHNVGLEFIGAAAEDLVRTTPGRGNQQPEDTKYEPTGRLRGGYNLVQQKIGTSDKGLYASKYEQGPFSEYGIETIARLKQQAAEITGPFGKRYIENDVGYGEVVRLGLGNHRGLIRNWPLDTSARMPDFFREALARASTK